MHYILKLNLLSQRERHHLVTTVSDNIFILIHFICPFLTLADPFPEVLPAITARLATHIKSNLYSTVLRCVAAQQFFLPSLPCHDDVIS